MKRPTSQDCKVGRSMEAVSPSVEVAPTIDQSGSSTSAHRDTVRPDGQCPLAGVILRRHVHRRNIHAVRNDRCDVGIGVAGAVLDTLGVGRGGRAVRVLDGPRLADHGTAEERKEPQENGE